MRAEEKAFKGKVNSIVSKLREECSKEGLQELKELFEGIWDKEEATREDPFEKERQMDIFQEGTGFRLCKIQEKDREPYLALMKARDAMVRADKVEGYEDFIWNGFKEEKTFCVVIREKQTDAFMGYCDIENIYSKEWVVAIMLAKEYQGQGYGPEVLKTFLQGVKDCSGVSNFIAKVDGENLPSQRMCEKVGAKPGGITEHLLHDQAYMEEYEKEHAHEVTDVMREVAKKFGVQPEKLLTHVLLYRFEI